MRGMHAIFLDSHCHLIPARNFKWKLCSYDWAVQNLVNILGQNLPQLNGATSITASPHTIVHVAVNVMNTSTTYFIHKLLWLFPLFWLSFTPSFFFFHFLLYTTHHVQPEHAATGKFFYAPKSYFNFSYYLWPTIVCSFPMSTLVRVLHFSCISIAVEDIQQWWVKLRLGLPNLR